MLELIVASAVFGFVIGGIANSRGLPFATVGAPAMRTARVARGLMLLAVIVTMAGCAMLPHYSNGDICPPWRGECWGAPDPAAVEHLGRELGRTEERLRPVPVAPAPVVIVPAYRAPLTAPPMRGLR